MLQRLQSKYTKDNYKFGGDDDVQNSLISQFDSKFIKWLVNFHSELGRDNINISEIGDLLQQMKHIFEDQQSSYLEALLYPEYAENCRIPRIIPVKAAAFKATYEFRFTSNNLGNFCAIFNPYAVLVQGSANTPFWLNNVVGMTGNLSDNNFTGMNIGYQLNPIYVEACLVSCAISFEAQVNNNTNSGQLILAVIHDSNITTEQVGIITTSLAKYGNYNLLRTGFFNDSVNINKSQGIRGISFPIDNTYESFLIAQAPGLVRSDTVKAGFAFACCGQGLQGVQTIICRIVANWECLPDSAFVNVIPSSFGSRYTGSEQKSNQIRVAQKRPITPTSNGGNYDTPQVPEKMSFWDSIKNFGQKLLPGIGKLAEYVGAGFGPEGMIIGSAINSKLGTWGK